MIERERKEYLFSTSAEWIKDRSGVIEQPSAVPENIAFSAPPEFHGEDGKWNPETLLLGAVASCFVATFHALAEYSSLSFNNLLVVAEGVVKRVEGKLQLTSVRIKPTLEIEDESNREHALTVLEKTKQSCLISRSLSADIVLLPELQVRAAVA